MIPFDEPTRIFRHMVFGGIGFILMFSLLMCYMKVQDKAYPLVETNSQFYGMISSLSSYQSIIKIELASGIKLRLPASRNYGYDPYQLNEFLKVADFIEKKNNSDTLRIIRENSEYYFVLGKHINENLRKD